MSDPGPENFLSESIYNGQLGHALKHNETNDQINWLTEQVGPIVEQVEGRLSEAELSASYGHPCSTDGTDGLPTPTGVGLEFVITADGLDDIRFGGVSL